MQFTASGDPTQMDCVDVATNTTSYLLVLQANGLIKHPHAEGTMSKENLAKGIVKLNPAAYWPHWSAILEREGERPEICRRPLAVRPGRDPAVVKVEDCTSRTPRTTELTLSPRGRGCRAHGPTSSEEVGRTRIARGG